MLDAHAKAERNFAKHGVSFEEARAFEFETALIVVDNRRDYGEVRYAALGFIGDRLHQMAYTLRDGAVRVISLRKANERENRIYEESI
ncbi:BrnT family toxin [Chelativorans sp. M5D2P16]|uniref:BrnT family toxin n=1 Tax=Chelativorans sp. M5D2P16 TaxID=3095678 RepID=UPI002ACAEC4D|nr:BrnT family toxin [Chelativorans sp. M5D2P16]MDZ5697824.1 BrnT family toxin [Chelativorans sp. M5D2P16]